MSWVWLYQDADDDLSGADATDPGVPGQVWVRYPMRAFRERTLAACGLPPLQV